LVAERA
jgi:hypothetical protein